MRRFLPFAIAGFLACGPLPEDYTLGDNQQQESIINGQACSRDEMPTAVAILVEADITIFGSPSHIKTVVCTGTLIAPDVVLAAAHCFDASLMTMGMGTAANERYFMTFESDLVPLAQQQGAEFPADTIEADSWVPHPEFSMDNMNNVSGPGDYKDIALMFLSQKVTHVRPEIVITADEASQITDGVSVEIAGWGQQTSTGMFEQPPPGTVGAKHCATSFINEVGPAEMQIGGDASTSRKCHGDSGGPTYLDISTNGEIKGRLVGVTSHAYDQSDCAKGGVDTRVDYWLDWIDSTMKSKCDERAWCEVKGIIPASFYGSVGSSSEDKKDDTSDGEIKIFGCASLGAGYTGLASLLPLALAMLWRRRRH